jgi:hypothetical protein
MSTPVPRFYVTGGTLRADTPSYMARRADTDLHAGLSRGEFCYVLTARQMGKSSLMVRTAQRLRAEGVTVVVLDLTAVGQNLSAEQWYGGLLDILGVQLDLEEALGRRWSEHSHLGPLQRWCTALRQVVLAGPFLSRRCASGRLVIFVDEVDAVRSLPFSTDEFFAAVRECYNRRSRDPIFDRLAVCLLGVAAPADLIRDERSTPFNIGRRIELTDFTDAEAAPLALGLGRTGPLGEALLKRALYWTGGHPYLTQRLCQAVAEESRAVDAAGVDRLCEAVFLCPRAQERDDNLLFVREQLLRGQTDPARLLLLYAQVRAGKPVRDDERSPFVRALRLSGIVRPMDGILAVRNRIYARVFDPQWVAEHAPSVDLWGQRAACRRAAARAVSERERQGALRGMELISSKHLERGARLLREGDSLGLLELLEARRLGGSARPSGEARSDLWGSSLGASTGRLRGVIGHEGPVFAAAFSPDGKLLATVSADETARLWLAGDGTPHRPPLKHEGTVVAVAFSPDGMLLATASLDGTARLWKAATGQPYGHLLRHEGRVQAVAFSPDGILLATGASDGSARLWQVGAGRLHDLPLCHQDEVRAVAFSANSRLLTTASADRTARLWHTATGEPHGRPLLHLDALVDVAFDRSGTLAGHRFDGRHGAALGGRDRRASRSAAAPPGPDHRPGVQPGRDGAGDRVGRHDGAVVGDGDGNAPRPIFAARRARHDRRVLPGREAAGHGRDRRRCPAVARGHGRGARSAAAAPGEHHPG